MRTTKQQTYSNIIMIDPSIKEEERSSTINSTSSAIATDEDFGHEITLDQLLDDIPIGNFHYRLLVICGMAFMADAMEVVFHLFHCHM
jgi:hypothetical protein